MMDKIDVLMELSAYGRDDLCEWANNNLQEKDGNATPLLMPISCAPMDGTGILLYCPFGSPPFVHGCWYRKWCTWCWIDGGEMAKEARPTHWMHLPKLPSNAI
jgi:hypothetical protein